MPYAPRTGEGFIEGEDDMKKLVDGYYWATSVKRNCTKKRPLGGQVGDLRWIVRVFTFSGGGPQNVQVFGGLDLRRLQDYRDYRGPINEKEIG